MKTAVVEWFYSEKRSFNSETLLSGKFKRGVNGEHELSRWASVNPGREQALGKGLLVGRSLVDLRSRLLPVRVMNLSNKPRKLPKGTFIGLCEPVISMSDVEETP